MSNNVFRVSDAFNDVPVASPSAIQDNNSWKLVGASAACVVDSNGGVKLTTTSSATGKASLQPVATSGFGGTAWNSNSQPSFTAQIKTPASLTGLTIDVGLAQNPSITNGSGINLNFAAVFFLYEPSFSANWVLLFTSGNGKSTKIITNIPVVAATSYLFNVYLDSNLNVFYTINGNPAYFNPVGKLIANTVLIPYLGCSGNVVSITAQNTIMQQAV